MVVSNILTGVDNLAINFTIAVYLRAFKNETTTFLGHTFMTNQLIIGCFKAKLESVYMI